MPEQDDPSVDSVVDNVEEQVHLVTSTNKDGDGLLSQRIPFPASACSGGYIAFRGDWVKAIVHVENSKLFASKVSPLRTCFVNGVITKYIQMKRMGFINDEIVFHAQVCSKDLEMRAGVEVECSAVECGEGSKIWRATSVKPCKQSALKKSKICAR